MAPQPDGCWLWTGGRKARGYGSFTVGKRAFNAHRWAYETWVGPIPEGLEIDHICANPPCVNPAHLEPVTHEENVRRWVERQGGMCKAGKHNRVETGTTNDGKCRACHNERRRVAGAVQYGDRTHCPQGHPYSGENLRVVKTTRGGEGRRCRACDRERNREQYQKRKKRGYYDK